LVSKVWYLSISSSVDDKGRRRSCSIPQAWLHPAFKTERASYHVLCMATTDSVSRLPT